MGNLIIHSKKHGNRELLYDDEDEAFVRTYSWHVWKHPTIHDLYYSRTNLSIGIGIQRTVAFHRLLLDLTDRNSEVDHINHNGLDNRRDNLRVCSRHQNQANARPGVDQTSKYKGVYFKKARAHQSTPWIAQIQVNNQQVHLGCFDTAEAAARAYNEAALKYFGDFALINQF